MNSTVFVGASFIASFIAGMIALFAPCCISFLLPAYFGTLFKERRRVLFMTVIYSFGIFSIFMPIILGAHFIFNWFMQFHDEVFIAGAIFMIALGVTSLLGWKMPMPKKIAELQSKQKLQGIGNVYLLGVFSGITSSCCAPVLLGVLSFSAFTNATWQAFGVGIFYVLGMVFPLYLASLALEKKQVLGKNIFQKRLWNGKISVSQLVSFIIFSGMGTLLFVLTILGKVNMAEWAQTFSQWIADWIVAMTRIFKVVPFLDGFAALGLLIIIFGIIRLALKKNNQPQ